MQDWVILKSLVNMANCIKRLILPKFIAINSAVLALENSVNSRWRLCTFIFIYEGDKKGPSETYNLKIPHNEKFPTKVLS